MHDSANDCKLELSNNIKDTKRMKNDPKDKKKVNIASALVVVVQGEVQQVLKKKKRKPR